MSTINYNNLDKELYNAIPEIESAYEAQLHASFTRTGPHDKIYLEYKDVLPAYLLTLLQTDQHHELVQRIFHFMEQVAVHGDNIARYIAVEDPCYQIAFQPVMLQKAYRYMGAATRRIADGIAPTVHLIESMMKDIPALRPDYEIESSSGTKPGLYTIFGSILMPHLLELLQSAGNEQQLHLIFAHIERLARLPQYDAHNLIGVFIWEALGHDPNLLRTALQYAGKNTRRSCHYEIEYWREKGIDVEQSR